MSEIRITDRLEEIHIQLVWEELESRFGFPVKEWKGRYEEYCRTHRANTDRVGLFYEFGNKYINPVLNSILLRRELHPTFNHLVEYVVGKWFSKKR